MQATVEVHPGYSQGLILEESCTLPTNSFWRKTKIMPNDQYHGPYVENGAYSDTRMNVRIYDFGLKNPHHLERTPGRMCYPNLYRSTRRFCC